MPESGACEPTHDGRERAAAEDLVDEHVVHEREARAARLARQVKRPVAERLRLGLHGGDRRRVRRPADLERLADVAPLERVDVLAHEGMDVLAQSFDLLGYREIHRTLPFLEGGRAVAAGRWG